MTFIFLQAKWLGLSQRSINIYIYRPLQHNWKMQMFEYQCAYFLIKFMTNIEINDL